MEQEKKPEVDPLVDAANKITPIQLTPDQWATLRPFYDAWQAPLPRVEEITKEAAMLASESKMLAATAEYNRDQFWNAVHKLFPDTVNTCLELKDDDGKQIIEKCGHDHSTDKPPKRWGGKVIEFDISQGMPPPLRDLLNRLRGINGGPI